MVKLGKPETNGMKWGIRYHYGYGVFIDYVEESEKYTPCIASVPTVILGEWLTLEAAVQRVEQFLQASLSVFRLRGDLPNDANELWNNDLIQFARMLSEIYANWCPESQVKELMDSMDLSRAQVIEVLDRAEKVWQASKENEVTTEPPRKLTEDEHEALVDSLIDTAERDRGFLRDLVADHCVDWNYPAYLDHFGGDDPLKEE